MTSRPRSPSLRARWIACAFAVLSLVAPGAPRAEDDEDEDDGLAVPTRVERPNALRGAGMTKAGGILGGQLWDAFAGLTYSRQVNELVALEVTGGAGPAGNRRGEHAGAGVRLSVVGRGAHALTAGAGAHVAFLPGYGDVGFGHLELAWELRTRGGFDLVLGGGVAGVMNTSRRVPERRDGGCWLFCDDEQFRAGDTAPWARLELGWAF